MNAALVAVVITRVPGAQGVDLASSAGIVIVTDTVLCAFASWYRRFLRGTQERQRAMREAREREKRREARTASRRPAR